MVSLKFHDCHDDTVMTLNFNKEQNHLFIHVYNESEDQSWGIDLDKLTAVKFSKELRKQIALLD